MSELLTLQDLANGHLDVKALGEAANGDENTIVTTRLGESYPSVKKAIKTLFENGGLPAEPFATKAKMETDGASLADGQLAQVYNEAVNNGLYVKTAGTWVKSAYDIGAQVKLINDTISGNDEVTSVITPELIDSRYVQITTGELRELAGYSSSKPFLLKAGHSIKVTTIAAGIAVISTAGATGAQYPYTAVVSNPSISETQVKTYSYYTDKDVYIVTCGKTSSLVMQDIYEPKLGIKGDLAEVSREVEKLGLYLSPFKTVETTTSQGVFLWHPSTDVTTGVMSGSELLLNRGDVLTFNYTPFAGTILWDDRTASTANQMFPLLTHTAVSSDVKSYKFTAPDNMKVRMTNGTNIKVNDKTPSNLVDLGVWGKEQYAVSNNAFAIAKKTLPIALKKGEAVKVTKPVKGAMSVVGVSTTGYHLALTGMTDKFRFGDPEQVFIADKDMTVILSGALDSEFLIRKYDGSSISDSLISVIEDIKDADKVEEITKAPSFIDLPEIETVFATAMNYILKTVDVAGVNKIAISKDLGKTWSYIDNILGDIVSYHFFSDGTILLCSPQKCYWTKDYVTLNESTILNKDGSPFVPATPTDRHFFAMQTGDKIDFIGDTEVFAFGDYTVQEGVRANLWYTVDRGKTIKSAFKSGDTVQSVGRVIRHFHRVYYHAKTNYFYMTTGDGSYQCNIIRGRYDVATDNWDLKFLATGDEYKFGNIIVDDNNMAYLVTDYTAKDLQDKKGIYRVHVSGLNDINNYEMIHNTAVADWSSIAPVSLLMDRNGNKVLLPDYLGVGFIWVAMNGLDFQKVTLSPKVLLAYTIGENYNGDVYCVAYQFYEQLLDPTQLKLNRGTYNLTKALRNAGIDDFMKGTLLINNMNTVVS